MKNFCIFADALEYIEQRLCEEITQQEIADACYCSLSALQKIWRCCSHTSIKEYISRRRLANNAKELLNGEKSITEIAFMYQYNSPEVFTRAFAKMWEVPPSKFREKWRNSGLFPRFIADSRCTGGKYMGRKVDITELYDFLRSKSDTYVLCFDVRNLLPINDNFGMKARDAVLLEAFRRLDEAASDDMAAFRIGGDEFAVITGLSDPCEVENFVEKVIAQNGVPIVFEGTEIPVAFRVGAIKYKTRPFRYDELFKSLHDTLQQSQSGDKVDFYGE
ncbi:MAG: diguanylate cyclase [Ruminococcus sp.]|uniref:helix-turn-helix domain-containing protein n=1 Tax=Ruminococcus sp. TaxID=41978 RepID=UPI0025F674F4|nr:helix-turn-helix domain-containing protein [Ruminococcus sp.]MCR5599396.1 diguanylate cyclase [Ruminococcus sp.]